MVLVPAGHRTSEVSAWFGRWPATAFWAPHSPQRPGLRAARCQTDDRLAAIDHDPSDISYRIDGSTPHR